jgi:DNA-binding transcriptional MerR regulator
MASAAQPVPEIPDKTLFRIGEVSRLTDTKTFVLRYWESEFPTLQPVKSPSGHRLYRREDIETVFEIKRLLYEQGFTIAGARKHLAERNGNNGYTTSAAAAAIPARSVTIPVSTPAPSFADLAQPAIAKPPEAQHPAAAAAPQPPARSLPSLAQRKLLLDLHEELLAILTLLKRE